MSNMRVKDIRPEPAEIEYKNMKFLITDRPNDQTIHTFIQVCFLFILKINLIDENQYK